MQFWFGNLQKSSVQPKCKRTKNQALVNQEKKVKYQNEVGSMNHEKPVIHISYCYILFISIY